MMIIEVILCLENLGFWGFGVLRFWSFGVLGLGFEISGICPSMKQDYFLTGSRRLHKRVS